MTFRVLTAVCALALVACHDGDAHATDAPPVSACNSGRASPAGVTFENGRAVTPAEYALDGELLNVVGRLSVLANGLPLHRDPVFGYRRPGASPKTFLTPALVSGENTAAVEVVPAVSEAGTGPAVGPVRLRLWVCAPDGAVVPGTERDAAHVDSVVAAWTTDLQARWDDWGPAAADSARAWAEGHPVRVETSFTRPAGADGRPADGEPAFDAVVREAPVIGGTPADSARLRAYAVELRDMAAARDTTLRKEVRQSINDAYALAGIPPPTRSVSDSAWTAAATDRTGWFEWEPGTVPFEASDVRLRSWAGGRVWELYRDGADGLFQGPARGPYQEIYVGLGPDGELRVVRTNL